jgi:hypothetical protein
MGTSQNRQLGGADALIKLQPSDTSDSLKRALVYCHCLHSYAKKQVHSLLARTSAGEFGEACRDIAESGIGDYEFGKALKIITCISVHMVGLDHCSENGPPWLVDFLFETLKETDNLFPDPGAEAVIQRHGSWVREQMIHDVAVDVCEALGFGAAENSAKAAAALEELITNSGPYRSELLVFSLSQPFEALRYHLQTMG